MSLGGLLALKGSTVTVKRGTRTPNTDGTHDAAWAATATGIKMLLEPITSELAQRIWGQETEAEYRGMAVWGTDIEEGDGVLVTAGNYASTQYRVVEKLPMGMTLGTRHVEVGLHLTPETFA